jgi:hypothetical protein
MPSLFDLAPEPKPKKPTAPQMRFLHVLAHNVLEIKTLPWRALWLKETSGNYLLWHFHPTVANNVVMNGWAEMKSFAKGKAEYRISEAGKEALTELCEHVHNPYLDESSEVLAGHLICRKCARSLRCRSKQPTPHPANFRHERYGPMCNQCWEFLGTKGTSRDAGSI